MPLLILPVSLDPYKNLTSGFLLLFNYLLLSLGAHSALAREDGVASSAAAREQRVARGGNETRLCAPFVVELVQP